MKVSELEGAQLDYWVAKAVGHPVDEPFAPSRDWAIGGPIIQQEGVCLVRSLSLPASWFAAKGPGDHVRYGGATALIAAMRLVVAAKFGPSVPDST